MEAKPTPAEEDCAPSPNELKLNSDTWRHCLSFVSRLELLRVNVCSKLLHGVSSTPAALLPQWRGFVTLSDRLRKNIFRGANKPPAYGEIDRSRAIDILRRRCQYCRLPDCKYVNEFRPRERVCERCERERHLSTFKLVANPEAHGVTEAEIYGCGLTSIERGAGKSAVTLFLATDIDAVLRARRDRMCGGGRRSSNYSDSSSGASDSDDDYVNPKVKKWKAKAQKPSRRHKKKQQGGRKRGGKLGRPFFLETPHLRHASHSHHRRNQKKKKNMKHSFTTHQQQQYDIATSGWSCLMLADF